MQPDQSAEEIKVLRRCINDLVGVLALPAIWSGGDPSQIARTLIDVLLGMLRLDLIYVRLSDGDSPVEMLRLGESRTPVTPPEIGRALNQWMGPGSHNQSVRVSSPVGGGDISIVSLPLGLQGEIGVVVAGSRRADFPGQNEGLVLSVAVNQAVIGLQEARLLREQKRVADELERHIAQRTGELAAANAELKLENAERKQAEENLRRSEEYLAEAQRISSTGNFSWRPDTREFSFSDELYRIFDFEPDTPVTLERIAARVHPEDMPLVTEMIEQARSDITNLDYELRLRMPDDAVKYLRTIAHGSLDQAGRVEYIGAVQDVSERRLSDDALGQARSELAHVARVATLGALTASIAHEVNQPLSGIITNASTCLRMLAADPPNLDGARETARRTIRDGNRASDVITGLRALFANEAIATELVDLNDAAQEVIALSRSELQRSAVVLRLEFADALPPVMGDRIQLQQVILNLLLNAADAMSSVDNRPRQVTLRTEHDGADRVRLSVTDAGVGFGPDGADKLFEPFYTTKRSGMGVGLAVSRSIIESHHGRLWGVPNDGPGVSFAFSIPYRPAMELSAT